MKVVKLVKQLFCKHQPGPLHRMTMNEGRRVIVTNTTVCKKCGKVLVATERKSPEDHQSSGLKWIKK
jgi:uncharacterized OB-fold protein